MSCFKQIDHNILMFKEPMESSSCWTCGLSCALQIIGTRRSGADAHRYRRCHCTRCAPSERHQALPLAAGCWHHAHCIIACVRNLAADVAQAVKTKVVEPYGDAVRVLEVVWRHAAMLTPGMSTLSRSIFNCVSNEPGLRAALDPVRPPAKLLSTRSPVP